MRAATPFLPLPTSIRMTIYRLPFVAGALLLSLSLAVAPANAQEWRQEIEIITPIKFGEPTYVFLDTLAAVLDRNPEMRVRRSVDDSSPQPYAELREKLYEEGVDVRSASHAFIDYRFELNPQGSGIVETIKGIYFIFRLDENYSDLPILYVDTRDPEISTLLTENGIPSMVNMNSVSPFRQMMAFPAVSSRQETAIVELGRRALRDDLAPEHVTLLSHIYEHMSMGTYVLATSHQRIASVR